jgi:hypothetical protein
LAGGTGKVSFRPTAASAAGTGQHGQDKVSWSGNILARILHRPATKGRGITVKHAWGEPMGEARACPVGSKPDEVVSPIKAHRDVVSHGNDDQNRLIWPAPWWPQRWPRSVQTPEPAAQVRASKRSSIRSNAFRSLVFHDRDSAGKTCKTTCPGRPFSVPPTYTYVRERRLSYGRLFFFRPRPDRW